MTKQIKHSAAGGEPRPHPEGPRPPIGDDPAERKPEEKLPGKPVQTPPGEDLAGEGSPGLTLAGGGGHA